MVDLVSNTTAHNSVVIGFFFDIDVLEELEEEDPNCFDDLQDRCRILTQDDYYIAEDKIFIGLDLFDFEEDNSCKNKEYNLQEITHKIIELKMILAKCLDIDLKTLPEPTICGMSKCYR